MTLNKMKSDTSKISQNKSVIMKEVINVGLKKMVKSQFKDAKIITVSSETNSSKTRNFKNKSK